jgi:hypothetical protein
MVDSPFLGVDFQFGEDAQQQVTGDRQALPAVSLPRTAKMLMPRITLCTRG